MNTTETVGFGKLLRSNYPTDQLEMLQILINGGISSTVEVKNLEGDILTKITTLWDKNLSQKEMRYCLRLLLGNIIVETNVELAVISIRKPTAGLGEDRHIAVDIVEPEENGLEAKIHKWRMIKKYNDDQDTNEWNRYDDISPKCQSITANYEPYNIIHEFGINKFIPKTIELTLWSPSEISKYITTDVFHRTEENLSLNTGIPE